MPRPLHPVPDLTFQVNTRAGNGTDHATKALTIGGNIIADDDQRRPIKDRGQHILGKAGCIERELEAMADSIIGEDWLQFSSLSFRLKELRPPKTDLKIFFAQQIEDAVARNSSPNTIETIRRKLAEIGADERTLDSGYEAGYKRLQQLQLQRPRHG